LTEFLVEEIKSYEDFKNLDWKEYSRNRHIKRDVEHWLENIVNASIDIVKIILASEKLPRSFYEYLIEFVKKNYLK